MTILQMFKKVEERLHMWQMEDMKKKKKQRRRKGPDCPDWTADEKYHVWDVYALIRVNM